MTVMLMNKNIVYAFSFLILVGCKGEKTGSGTTNKEGDYSCAGNVDMRKLEKEGGGLVPDTSVNGLRLNDYVSTSAFYPGEIILYPESQDRRFPSSYFSSRNGKYGLKISRHYGSSIGCYSVFEIYDIDLFNTDCHMQMTQYDKFKTESEIELGLSMDEVLAIKGDGYTESKSDNYKIISYALSVNASFVKRYRMPGYFATFTFRRDTLVKYTFGFQSE